MKTWTVIAILVVAGIALSFGIGMRNACAQDDNDGYEGAQVPYPSAPDPTDNRPYIVPNPFGGDPALTPPLNPEGYGNEQTLPEDEGTNTMDGYSEPGGAAGDTYSTPSGSASDDGGTE